MWRENVSTHTPKRRYVPDEDVIIPNSHVSIPTKEIKSFKMTIDEFKLRLQRISGLHTSFESSVTSFIFHPECSTYFRRVVQLENGFCYAEIFEKNKIDVVCVGVLFYSLNNKVLSSSLYL